MMKKGNHPLKMYGKSPLKETGYRENKFLGGSKLNEPEDNNKYGPKTPEGQESGNVAGLDRAVRFSDYFGGGQNLRKEGPFSELKAKLEDKQKQRQDTNVKKYRAAKGEQFNKLVDTSVELEKKDYSLPTIKTEGLERLPEIDESSVDLSAFQVSDGYNKAMMRGKIYQASAEYKKMKNGK